MLATSATSTWRCKGALSAAKLRIFVKPGMLRAAYVFKGPADTAFTRTPRGPISCAR